jgi:hypothetical protein
LTVKLTPGKLWGNILNNYVKAMKHIIKLTIPFLACVLLCSCAPRGENQSVDQVLKTQHDNFNSFARNASINEAAAANLKTLTDSLSKLEATEDAKAMGPTSEAISDNISNLILKAGFTSRPALTELSNQYRAISQNPDGANHAAVKLLMARTYSALAAELETTKFAL